MSTNFSEGALQDAIRRAVMQAVVRGTESVRAEAISLVLNTPKTGRIYRRRSVEHQASAPGEPPASDTGRLVNSIRTSYDAGKLLGTVTASTRYAPHLEYGTQRVEPRPFLRPALATKRKDIEQDIRGSVSKALRAAT